jgi:hypothetical protein
VFHKYVGSTTVKSLAWAGTTARRAAVASARAARDRTSELLRRSGERMPDMSQSVGVPTLVLWDADHTLIENGGVNKLNYLRAFEGLVGYEAKSRPQTDGRTDIEIMRNLFSAHDVDGDAYSDATIVDALASAMRGELRCVT